MEIYEKHAHPSRVRDTTQRAPKEFLEIVGNGETNGQCVKGDNCSIRHDMNKRGKSYTIKSVSEFFHAAE